MASSTVPTTDETTKILVKTITGRIKPEYWPGKQVIKHDFSPVAPHVIRIWCENYPSNTVALNLKTCETTGSITMEEDQTDARKKSNFVVNVSNKGKSFRVDDTEHLPFWLQINLVKAIEDQDDDGSD